MNGRFSFGDVNKSSRILLNAFAPGSSSSGSNASQSQKAEILNGVLFCNMSSPTTSYTELGLIFTPNSNSCRRTSFARSCLPSFAQLTEVCSGVGGVLEAGLDDKVETSKTEWAGGQRGYRSLELVSKDDLDLAFDWAAVRDIMSDVRWIRTEGAHSECTRHGIERENVTVFVTTTSCLHHNLKVAARWSSTPLNTF